ncbi:MAG TPA: hypothetical protein VH062_01840 [Polyangiaceae bacterium]|jgi:hypothetical protein|nr:hypothetical protein [Polyangiaceae bacterium]
MTFFARLLAAALLLPQPYYLPGHEPETASERAQRVEVIVSSAVAESREVEGWPGTPDDLAAAILSVTWFESRRWALEVHSGKRRGDHGASVCLAQIWTYDRTLAGTSPEATRRCFHKAAQILAMHANRCGIHRMDEPNMARLLGAYGTGRTCHTMPWARKRARLWARLMDAAAADPTTPGMPADHALPGKLTSLVDDDAWSWKRPARAKTVMSITAH